MKKIILSLVILFMSACVSHENEWVLSCHIEGHSIARYSKERIYYDPDKMAYYVDGNWVPPGGALCLVYYND